MATTLVPATLRNGIDSFPRLLDGQPGDVKDSFRLKTSSPSAAQLASLNELRELLENIRGDLSQLEEARSQRFSHLKQLCEALSKRKHERAVKAKATAEVMECTDHKPSEDFSPSSRRHLSNLDLSKLTLDQFASRLTEAGLTDMTEDSIVELLDTKSIGVEPWPYGSEVDDDSEEAARAFHPWASNLDLLHKDVKFIADRIRHEEVVNLLGVWRMQMDHYTLQNVKAAIKAVLLTGPVAEPGPLDGQWTPKSKPGSSFMTIAGGAVWCSIGESHELGGRLTTEAEGEYLIESQGTARAARLVDGELLLDGGVEIWVREADLVAALWENVQELKHQFQKRGHGVFHIMNDKARYEDLSRLIIMLRKENCLMALPRKKLTEEELHLREVLVDFLFKQPAGIGKIADISMDPRVREAWAVFSKNDPQGISAELQVREKYDAWQPLQLHEWVDRRIGKDVSCEKDGAHLRLAAEVDLTMAQCTRIERFECTTEEEKRPDVCCVCFDDDEEVDARFLPCRHCTTCFNCAQRMETCPKCRVPALAIHVGRFRNERGSLASMSVGM